MAVISFPSCFTVMLLLVNELCLFLLSFFSFFFFIFVNLADVQRGRAAPQTAPR